MLCPRDGVAACMRFMSRSDVDDLDKALTMLDWQDLNEFKRTVAPR